jgi:Spy/CpxP family protein refolding chaperone
MLIVTRIIQNQPTMKSTRNSLFAFCVLAFGLVLPSAVLRAEDAPPAQKERGPKGDREEMMKERLGLSDDQAAKIKQIHADSREEMKKLKDDENLSREDKMARRKELHEATRAKVDAVLTAEQRTKAEEMRKKGEQMRKEKGYGPGEGGKGGKREKRDKKKSRDE